MAHPFSNRPSFNGLNDSFFGFAEGRDLDTKTLARLEQMAGGEVNGDYIWRVFHDRCAAEFETLRSQDAGRINDLVKRLFGTALTHGFLQGAEVYNRLKSDERSRRHVGSIIFDRFFRLAEAVGVTRVLSAEHGQNTIDLEQHRVDEIFSCIEEAVGIDLTPPVQAGAMFGLRLRERIYSERHFDAIYAAWKAMQIAKANNIENPTLCEIGGGAGHLTFYAKRMFSRCSLIDLPQARIVQFILLASDYGPDAVSTSGGATDKPIQLLDAQTDDVSAMSESSIVINVDSFPEMPVSAAKRYFSKLNHKQILFSINQESGIDNGIDPQNVVRELAAEFDLSPISRNPSWLRTGYIEECFVARSSH